MKPWLTGAALCVLLAGTPVWAQPQSTAQRGTTGTSAPPQDPFRNGGRPETSAGDPREAVHEAATDISRLPQEVRATLREVAETTVTAQQYGNLASMRRTFGAVHNLGDSMAVTCSRFNRTLEGSISHEMPAEEQPTFDALARYAGGVEFGVSVAQWIADTYPETIAALERLGERAELREAVQEAIPDLRAQLAQAREILRMAAQAPEQLAAAPAGSGQRGGRRPLD